MATWDGVKFLKTVSKQWVRFLLLKLFISIVTACVAKNVQQV